jgi:hypothetical protein
MAQTEKSLFDLTEEKLSLGRWVQPALDPLEEVETKGTFQFLDTFADSRLGHMQNIRRARRGSVGHDHPEDLNLPKIHRAPQSITFENSIAEKAYAFRLGFLKRSQPF